MGTGGGGHVGFHIALKLVQFKHQVVLLDLNHPHRTWAKYHIEDSSQHEIIHTSNGSMKFVKGDIRDRDLLMTATENIDCVIHTVVWNVRTGANGTLLGSGGRYQRQRDPLRHRRLPA